MLVYAADEYTHINSHSAPEMRNNNGAAKRNSGMGTILNTTHSKNVDPHIVDESHGAPWVAERTLRPMANGQWFEWRQRPCVN